MGEAAAQNTTQIVGRYAIHGEIASGGMATVHYGRLLGPIGFSRPVAIKRLHPQFAREDNVRSMFIDEARLAARIHHPNVVQTLDVIEEGSNLLLVMEYVNGEPLGKLARACRKQREHVPVPIALAIMASALHGLHAAHEAKAENGQPLDIVHRDVSPQNIIVGIDGVARVLDFGIARAAVRLESTREGLVKGKLAYMAPEQLLGTAVTRQADIFAAGVVLWELLAGRRLFLRGDDGDDSVLIEKLLRGELEPPSTYNRDLDPKLDAITKRALDREPEKRFASAREMALELEHCGHVATASTVSAWVERVASESLSARAQRVHEFERSSSHLKAATPAVSEGGEAAREISSSGSHLTPSLNPHIPATVPVPQASPRSRAFTMVAVALVAIGFGVGGSQIAGAVRGGAARATSPVIAAEALPPPPPPKPTCPSDMKTIPGGKFFMGSDDDLPLERPAHNVTLSPYCIDTFEVTTGDYRTCSDRGECKRAGIANEWNGITEQERKTYDPLCNVRDPSTREHHPINCVDWEMAEIYCKSAGKRLPTEAEWEFAARGPDGRKYPWGDDAPNASLLNACGKECIGWGKKNRTDLQAMFDGDDGWATTAPVGSFPKGASRYGVQDVVGNVWEWTSDFYSEYSREEQSDPKGPEKGSEHVIRGGSWNGAYASWVRPTFRYKDAAEKRSYGIGFRCAKAL
jgi:formylglycine-generating enzyme required for sulfatase activity